MADPFRIFNNHAQRGYFIPYSEQEPQFSLSAFLSGSSAGNSYKSTYQWDGIRQSEAAYRSSYFDYLNSGASSHSGALLFDASQHGLDAMNSTLRRFNIETDDLYGSYLNKALNFLLRKSSTSEPKTYLNPEIIAAKAQLNEAPGDYVVHVMKKDYLNNPVDSKLANGKLAWFAPIEDIAGFKLDQESILRAVGFDADTISNNPAGTYLLAVYQTKELGKIEKPTWDFLINKANTDSNFDSFKKTYGESFFNDLPSLDYSKYIEIRKKSGNLESGSLVDQFLTGLPARERDLYKARALIENQYGANHLFSGKGFTIDPLEKYAVREFVISNEKVISTPPHGMLELNSDGSTAIISNSFDAPPNKLLFSRDTAYGGAFGAISAIATGLYGDYTELRAGKITFNELLNKLPSELSQNGVFGFGSGVVENVVEKSTTQAIIQRFGSSSTLLGQTIRQIPGALGAGALISLGTSSFDQLRKYRNDQIKFSEAGGNIVSETVVGGTSSVIGAGLGSWFTGKIVGQGAGLILGGLSGVGLGIAAGVGADWLIRSQGWDKAIASWTSNRIEDISYFATDTWEKAKIAVPYVWQGTKYYSGVAWDGTKSVVSDSWDGIKYGASTAWDATSSTVNGIVDWTTSWFK